MQQLGRYQIIKEIGAGGFATVYLAEDTVLKRKVTLKVMHPALMMDRRFVTRFEREAQLVANLEHPNIVTIHDYGEQHQRLFIVMGYLAGGTLRDRIAQQPLSWEEATRVLTSVADALDYAHARGITHRDIKPANILFDDSNRPILADFGLLKALDQTELSISMSGGILGTPAYIPPEIWNGEDATAQTDVYALACVLYESVIGERLFDGATPPAVMTKHFRPPALPEAWPDDVPSGLTAVLRKALSQVAGERYESASDLVQASTSLTVDLLAEPYAALQGAIEAKKWTDAIGIARSILEQDSNYRNTSQLMQQAVQQKADTEKEVWVAQWREQAESALANGNLVAAQAAAKRWEQLVPNDPDLSRLKQQLNSLKDEKEPNSPLIAADKIDAPKAHQEPVKVDSNSGNRRNYAIIFAVLLGLIGWLAIGNRQNNSNTGDSVENTTATDEITATNTVARIARPTSTPVSIVAATKTPKPTATLLLTATDTPPIASPAVIRASNSHLLQEVGRLGKGQISAVDYSPDGKTLAVGGATGVYLYDAATLVENHFIGTTSSVRSVAYSPDGERLVSGLGDNTIKVWSANNGTLQQTLEGHTNSVLSVAYSPDGMHIASGSSDRMIKVWRVGDGTLLQTLDGHLGSVRSVTYSPDGSQMASGSNDGTIKVWSVEDGTLLHTIMGHANAVLSVAFSPDGMQIASGSNSGTGKVWRVADGTLLRDINPMITLSPMVSVIYSPDGSQLVTGKGRGTVEIRSASDGALLHTLEGHTNAVYNLNYSPDGEKLATGSIDGTVRIWNTNNGALLQTLEGHTSYVRSTAYSPDGMRIASGLDDGTIKIWSLSDNSLHHTFFSHTTFVYGLTYSPSGELLASGTDDGTVRLWRASDGSLLQTLDGHTNSVRSVTYSPSGMQLASGSWDKTIKIWRVSDGKLLHTLEGHLDIVRSVTYSPDGDHLASGSDDGTIKIWRVSDGELLHTLERHLGIVRSVTYSPDGEHLTSGSDDGTIRIWRVSNGELLRTLEGHLGVVRNVTYSPDGDHLASGSDDGTIKLWEIDNGKLLQTLEGHTLWVMSVTYSPNGEILASGSLDGTVRLWGVVDD